nr:MAG TPA: pecanex protein [Bacteriophage sp.]DAN36677.1 MAG TPA: pecanex protein [Caudoviricetes sp.]
MWLRKKTQTAQIERFSFAQNPSNPPLPYPIFVI